MQLEVPAQQVLVQLRLVLLGRRHHVGLEVQAALLEVEPHRVDGLLLARHPNEPATLAGSVSRSTASTSGSRRAAPPAIRRCSELDSIEIGASRRITGSRPGSGPTGRRRGDASRPAVVDQAYRRDRSAAASTHPGRAGGIGQQLVEAGGVVDRIAADDEEAGDPVVDQRSEPADRRRHDRDPARRRFERHQTERLGTTGNDHHIGRPVVGRQDVVRLRVDHHDRNRSGRGRRRAWRSDPCQSVPPRRSGRRHTRSRAPVGAKVRPAPRPPPTGP